MSNDRLTLFLPALYGGGAERVMVRLAREFARRGVPVEMVLARAVGPYLQAVSGQVAVVDLRAHRVLTSLPRVVGYLRRTRPRALLSTMAHANAVAVVARRIARTSTRVVVRETVAPISKARHLRTLSVRAVLIASRSYRAADAIVANSRQVCTELSQLLKLPPDAIHLIPNPVVEPELETLAQMPAEHPWFADSTTPIIIGVGRLTAQKDFATLIRATAILNQDFECRLAILGEGEQRPELERLVQQLGLQEKVWMPGFETNPYRYIARASIFVLPSRWEGAPNALIEALACGVRSVATDCPGGVREILEDGKWGMLTPVGDAQALAAAITHALQSPPDPDALRQRAQAFAVDTVAEQYLRILEQP